MLLSELQMFLPEPMPEASEFEEHPPRERVRISAGGFNSTTKLRRRRPIIMLRFGENFVWLILLAVLLCFPFRNATAQAGEAAGTQPSQNRMPTPQATPAATQPNGSVPTASSTTTKQATSHKKKSTAKQKPPEPEVAQAPVIPPTLEQMPPSAPRVSYQNGQLSINAHNATLSQVLRSVQQQTGASIDVPSGASGERVVADLGPGRPRDVLATLLNGSHFNYVILGTPGNSGGVQKVILTPRQNATTTTTTAQVNSVPQQSPPPSAEDDPPEEDQVATYPDSDVPQGTPLVPTPTPPGGTPGGPPPDGGDPSQQQNQVKTPEQLLQELQRMQQQQQQYQQQLNPANQQPPTEQPQ